MFLCKNEDVSRFLLVTIGTFGKIILRIGKKNGLILLLGMFFWGIIGQPNSS